MIEARQLTKRYGDKTAVDHLTFTVKPGHGHRLPRPQRRGQVHHDAHDPRPGRAHRRPVTVNGRRYAQHAAPLHEVGALLEAKAVHPGRTAFDHLLALAHTHGIPRRRVDEVLELAGLQSVAQQARRRLLPRHGPAARHRRRAARRPGRPSCSTSRSTASTPRASSGSATC